MRDSRSYLSISLALSLCLSLSLSKTPLWCRVDTFMVSSPGLLGKGSAPPVVRLIPFNRPLFLADTPIKLTFVSESDR